MPLRPWLLALLPLGYLWFILINQLRPEWTSNPQYSYGWFVPILCLGLIWHRAVEPQRPRPDGPVSSAGRFRGVAIFLLLACAVLFLPSRMLQAADPAWRLVSWLLALDVVLFTLCSLYLVGGEIGLSRYAFPICFFLVAVPWLYPIEKWVVGQLTFAASAATVELVGLLGLPAVAHGKVIEIGTGVVGIDEACSGIRSFQSSLMISLFLGACCRLTNWRRIALVLIGFVLAFAFNVCRTSILTWIAANKGVAAIAHYHDQAGLTILLACTISMWLLTFLMRKPETKADLPVRPSSGLSPAPQPSTLGSQPPQVASPSGLLPRGLVIPSVALILWFGLVEIAVAVWSHTGTSCLANATKWSIAWPIENSTFQRIEPDANSLKLLQYDEAQQGQWIDGDGTSWRAFYFNWHPGRVGAYLAANRHSPEICMTYAGWKMQSGPDRIEVKVKGLRLPFRVYSFTQGSSSLHIFHCRWEPAFETNPALLQQQGLGTTLRGFRGISVLWSGRGKTGQKILEVMVQGCETAEEAQAAFVRQLEKLINVEERNVTQ